MKYFDPQKGKLNLHLVAKPKDDNAGFYKSSKRSLHWTEMFLLMLCRKKNPEITNIVGHAFLEDCAIEGITYPSKGRGRTIKTFRSALGFDSSGMAGGNSHKSSPQPSARPITQPATQTQTTQPSAQNTQTQPIAQITQAGK